jgi:hypothetical protein
MRALLDTGSTSNIMLREFTGKYRSRTNAKKRKSEKHLEVVSPPLVNPYVFQIPGDQHNQSYDVISSRR